MRERERTNGRTTIFLFDSEGGTIVIVPPSETGLVQKQTNLYQYEQDLRSIGGKNRTNKKNAD